jgi:hypothetical protein
VREQCIALEHGVDRALVRLGRRYVLATDKHLACGWFLKTGHDSKRGGLATTRRAKQSEELTGWDVKVHVLERSEPREIFTYVF